MISTKLINLYCCEDISLIENYDKAINDDTQTWDCHHRREKDDNLSATQLIKLGLYYNRPASELIFLTHSEHQRLHAYGRIPGNKGKKCSEETNRKNSEAHKGEKHYMYGKHHSEETRQKLSEAKKGEKNPNYGKPTWNKGIPRSEETKQKLRDAITGKHRVYHADGTYHYEK